MIEITLGNRRFQIRQADPLNLKIYEFKTVKEGKEDEREDWVHNGCYFSTLEYAIRWIYLNECNQKIAGSEEALTLKEAVEQMNKIEKHLISQIKKEIKNEGK